jgi:SAM-dependent methyltransferase
MPTLDIGCGDVRDPAADVGMDFYPFPGATIVHDVSQFPWPIEQASFDRAIAHEIIEHLPVRDDTAGEDLFFRFFDEVWRILKPGGILDFDVPHANGTAAYGDPTHRRFFTEEAFNFLWNPKRGPLYPRKLWELVELKVDYFYGAGGLNQWHFRKYLPRIDHLFCRMKVGTPHLIWVTLRKPISDPPVARAHPSSDPASLTTT